MLKVVATEQVVADLRADIARITRQRDEAETARAGVAAALEAHQAASAARETDLGEEMLKARRTAEKLLSAEDDAVIAMEKSLRTKHEREISELRDRACKAEKRVRGRSWGRGKTKYLLSVLCFYQLTM